MTKTTIPQRVRIPTSVEGESEQSFIKWLYELTEQKKLHRHFDCQVLGGGGYKTMLKDAVLFRKRKERYKAKNSILMVDGDREERDDGWSLSQLRYEASKHKITVCVLQPNLEGLLLRLMSGNENLQPSAFTVQKQLRKVWPNYEKPADARTLASKFSLDDLLRVAYVDTDLNTLLSIIGLSKNG
jgi:hypothetical protein